MPWTPEITAEAIEMGIEILLVIVVLGLALLPALAGFDSRDGRDWQPPVWWEGRRGAPLD